jgi:hypothetical protein
MAGLVPAIHVFVLAECPQDVDARDKRGHDESILHYSLISPKLTLAPSFASTVFFGRPVTSISIV